MDNWLNHHLQKVSRTFALTIPRLPDPLDEQIGLGYLIFRISDTFEDATEWPPEKRARHLEEFSELLDDPDRRKLTEFSKNVTQDPPVEHEGYCELLEDLPRVVEKINDVDRKAQPPIRDGAIRTSRGMANINRDYAVDQNIVLPNRFRTYDYCYIVAGIVAETIMKLFLLQQPRHQNTITEIALRTRAPRFGEALQLTNIIRDQDNDAEEGRFYITDDMDKEAIWSRARNSIEIAREYVRVLQRQEFPEGMTLFCALILAMAGPTLDCVREHGPGASIDRNDLTNIIQRTEKRVKEGKMFFSQNL